MIHPVGIAPLVRYLGLADQRTKLDKHRDDDLAVLMLRSLLTRSSDRFAPRFSFVSVMCGLQRQWESFPALNSEGA